MKLVFATNNPNKLKEIQAAVPESITILGLDAIGCYEDIPEDQDTIEGNSAQKVNFIKTHYGVDSFADDTGLLVDALNGAPGVYSARYAGPQKSSEANMTKLLAALEEQPNRKAHFKTVISLRIGDKLHQFTGICEGEIIRERRGEKGFGYDPIFQPDGFEQTFAELAMNVKNDISHRGRAVKKLINFLKSVDI